MAEPYHEVRPRMIVKAMIIHALIITPAHLSNIFKSIYEYV
jgi:hypothetical protein